MLLSNTNRMSMDWALQKSLSPRTQVSVLVTICKLLTLLLFLPSITSCFALFLHVRRFGKMLILRLIQLRKAFPTS